MSDLTFYINIENNSGVVYGSGPITSADQWTYTASMDRAGSFSFVMLATDEQADIVQKKRTARAYALIDDAWTEVGAGIIDNIIREPNSNGDVTLRVSGLDLMRELTYRSVKDLSLTDSNTAITHADALTAISAYAPSGWTFTPDASPPNDSIYGRFNGESVLAALLAVAEKTETHFYRGSGRNITFASDFDDSGVRAIQAGPGDLSDETCAIVNISETIESYDLLTRIYPRGAGNGDVQLTLQATTRTAGTGYTLSAANNYIENDTATSTYGLIEGYVDWRDIAPVENTSADIIAASNMLYDEALRELVQRSVDIENAYYAVSFVGCSTLLRPLQTMRVIYRDVLAGIDIDEELNILEATWQVDTSGIQTTSVTVATSDAWPENDTDAIVDNVARGNIYQALPQLNANEYVTSFAKNVDADETAVFRFRFSNAVTALRWAFFEFQVLPFESTVRTVGVEGLTQGSGELETDAATGNTGSNNDNTGAASGDTGAASGNTGAASGDTGAASGDTGGSGTLTTEGPEGSEIDVSGHHRHGLLVYDGTPSGVPVYVDLYSGDYFLNAATGDNRTLPLATDGNGDHTHDLGNHTHTLNSHAHSLNSHTHSLNSHAHSLNNHAHSLNNHTHSLNNHTHVFAPVINTIYGIFREESGNTLTLAQMQYRVNSGSWVDLDTATALGDGWYRLDVSDDIRDSDTARPTQNSNTIEIQSALTTLNIDTITGGPTSFSVTTVETEHGLLDGDPITISGTTNFDGDYYVLTVSPLYDNVFFVSGGPAGGATESTGTVTPLKTATIDAQLSVHTTIQPIYI